MSLLDILWDKITEADLNNLISAGVPESPPIDYKRDTGNYMVDKADFLGLTLESTGRRKQSKRVIFPQTNGLEDQNCSSDQLGKLFKCWDNRLVFKGLSTSELYLKGRADLLVDLEVCSGPWVGQYGAILSHQLGVYFDESGGLPAENRNDQPVFVDDVEFVQTSERALVSNLRLHVQQCVSGIGGALYFSVLNGRLKSRPTAWKGKRHFFMDDFVIEPNKIANKEIEGGSEVVGCISNNKRKFIREPINGPGYPSELSGISIVLDKNKTGVFIKKGFASRLKVHDVAFGPLNL